MTEEYNLPESQTVLLDQNTNEVVKEEDITPWMIIKAIAEKIGTPIREPRKNCVHCYGRGYVGFRNNNTKKNSEGIVTSSREPVPCQCIFTEEQKDKDRPLHLNRKQRRIMEKKFKKMNIRKNIKNTKETTDE